MNVVSQPMRVSDLRALLAGVSDDGWVVIVDDDGHASPRDWRVSTTHAPGEPQSVLLFAGGKDDEREIPAEAFR